MKIIPGLILGAVLILPAGGAEPAASAPARATQVIDGVTYEYAPEHEAVVRELAPLITALNRESGEQAEATKPPPAEPLSVQDFREHRADYLARLAAAIGLEKATASQEQCYDAFLDNFEQTELFWDALRAKMRQMAETRDIAIWRKDDLMRRLKAGQMVTGFTLDPDGEHVTFAWNFGVSPEVLEQLAALTKEREQLRLDYHYHYSLKDGVATISGGVQPRQAAQAAHSEPAAPPPAATPLPAFPLVIFPDKASLPPGELAAELVKELRQIRTFAVSLPAENQAQLAYLLLHETTEIGMVGRYIDSPDRRWWCEGVANYTAWRIARDVAGEAKARQVYDLPAQLARFADLRTKIDLRKWPAAENERKEDADSPLTQAHYAYATRAVSLIVERHGAELLPRLFQEIGKTPREKTSMRTVAKAYKKLTREDLSSILHAALAPLAAPKSPP